MTSNDPSNAFIHRASSSTLRLKIIIIIGASIGLMTLFMIYWSSSSDNTSTTSTMTPAASQQTIESTNSAKDTAPKVELIKQSTKNSQSHQNAYNPLESLEPYDSLKSLDTIDSLDPRIILDAPLPASDSLAKEERDRLDDEYANLFEQEILIDEQIEMTKQLSALKAEQIELLEQQIAQLEAGATD